MKRRSAPPFLPLVGSVASAGLAYALLQQLGPPGAASLGAIFAGSVPAVAAWSRQLGRRAASAAAQREVDAARAGLRQLDITLRAIGEAVLATDVQGRLVRLNPAAEALVQRWAVDALAQPFDQLVELRPREAGAPRRQPVAALLAGGTPAERAERLVLRRPDGSERVIDLLAKPIREEDGALQGVVLVMRDVTSEHQLEDQVRRNQRVESLGQLAGGVAHDFNNLLQVVKVNLEFLAEKEGLDAEACEYVGEVQAAAARAADLTRQLLALARRQSLHKQPLDLRGLVDSFLGVLRRVVGAEVELVYERPADPQWVEADAAQLEQVLLNLCTNAREAMPLGGRLVLALERERLEPTAAELQNGLQPGSFVRLRVTDTGLGMDDATITRIFEPFYTTKQLGQGPGLGLAVTLGVVQQHGGVIRVESQLGHGSTFDVYLPAIAAPTAAASPVAPAATAGGSGKGCVLVVEDDTSVRLVSTAVLVRQGYRVVEAADGLEACELVRQRGDDFSLVVMDVIMPNMGGLEAAQEITRLRPDLPIVLCTGYAGGSATSDIGGDSRPWHLLAKPFGSHELLRAVAAAMSAPVAS